MIRVDKIKKRQINLKSYLSKTKAPKRDPNNKYIKLNEYLGKKYSNIFSLGYNCFPKKFIDFRIKQRETEFFDFIGTSMWTINNIIKNNFYLDTKEIFNKEDYLQVKLMNSETIIFNKKYIFAVEHELQEEKDLEDQDKFNKFVDKYTRRGARFIRKLEEANTNKKKLLFIRLEPDKSGMKIIKENKDLIKLSELDNLKEFSKLLKSKWKDLNFDIIYLSTSEKTRLMKENNILIINTGEEYQEYHNVEYKIENIIEANRQLLEKL